MLYSSVDAKNVNLIEVESRIIVARTGKDRGREDVD
jgi:hypothetical protein